MIIDAKDHRCLMPTCMFMEHNRCNVVAMLFIRKYQFTLVYIHAPIESETIVYGLRRNVVDLSDVVFL